MIRSCMTLFFAALLVLCCSDGFAQYSSNTSAVGGVLVDAEGMLSLATADQLKTLENARLEAMQSIQKGLDQTADTRRISLKKLNGIAARCVAEGKAIPDSVKYLGGLTAIENVFVYPEENDIVLVGPAEGWTVGPKGVMVGKNSGKPIMLLEDLVVAIRSASGSERHVFAVSIDPTEAGLKTVHAYVSQIRAVTNASRVAKQLEEKLGNQVVTLTGVEANSHFAYVLAAADYRMKQISMGSTKSPVKSLTSFVPMIQSPEEANVLPRWWMAPNYAAITRSEDGLAWSLSGGSVVTLTETEMFDGDRLVKKTVGMSTAFQKWADLMTENFDALSKAEPIFGQLRNCMDCAMVAAMIAEGDLLEKVNDLEALLSAPEFTTSYPVPRMVPSTAVVAKKGGGFLFTNGGVSIDMWKPIQTARVAEDLKAGKYPVGKSWWK
ncbi:MAG: DUF1598 domain-containing protein [Planctomycetia bacterium]|nr:DUF1598 domain-containing protein [Planctomycetia bacterium]